ncbi:GGDEF domain-containing protein [Kitasatospora sp. NPDC058048]|uniref:GGDEF domain-containing protein n=1 Tax=Kitasatospora sp. NPDC058048 TaxID=3346313 RepID=UPI0036DA6A46
MDVPTILAAGVPLIGWTTHGTWLSQRLATARRDPLTGLHTRDGFTARAHRLTQRHPDRASVLLIDLDDFKATNDTYGHAAGDAVITATAVRLSAWYGRPGIAARLGGDEFAAAVLNAPARLPDLRAALNQPVPYAGFTLPASASVGICPVAELPVASLTDALASADRDMYAHKRDGRTSRRR